MNVLPTGLRTLIASAVAIGALTAGMASAEELTVVGWGGALSAAEKNAMEDPFSAKTGITVNAEVYNGGLAQVKAQIESGKVIWDVLDAEMTDAELGCAEGLLEKIPSNLLAKSPDGIPAKDDFFQDGLHECGVANYVWATVFAYDAEQFSGAAPNKIADLFDVERFPGKRGLRKSPKTNLEWAVMADGVPADKVYVVLATPEGVERAFKVLDRLKEHVIWWEAGAQPPQMLADNEVAMTSAYNGRLYNAIMKEKQPFHIVWDGQIWDYGAFVIPKGAPNKDRAIQYVKFATSAPQLAELTNYISYGPARRSGMTLVSREVLGHLPTATENFAKGLRASAEFWADYGDELEERFNVWLAAQ